MNAAARLWGTGPGRGPRSRHALVIERFERKLGEHLRLVFRSFPITQIHPHVQIAAETAEAAADGERAKEYERGLR
jgi:hypothetical protein